MFLPVTLQLLEGFGETLKVFVMTLVFSIPLGLVVCFGSMSKFAPLRVVTRGFVWIIRGTPLMLQLIIIFYGPGLMFGLPSMSRFAATILAFSINYACYFSEIYRVSLIESPLVSLGTWNHNSSLSFLYHQFLFLPLRSLSSWK